MGLEEQKRKTRKAGGPDVIRENDFGCLVLGFVRAVLSFSAACFFWPSGEPAGLTFVKN